MVLFGSFSAISGRCPTLIKSGLETPVGVTTRISRAPSAASAVAVMLATIYHALGIDPHTIVYNHLNQPRELVQAEPVTGLFG